MGTPKPQAVDIARGVSRWGGSSGGRGRNLQCLNMHHLGARRVWTAAMCATLIIFVKGISTRADSVGGVPARGGSFVTLPMAGLREQYWPLVNLRPQLSPRRAAGAAGPPPGRSRSVVCLESEALVLATLCRRGFIYHKIQYSFISIESCMDLLTFKKRSRSAESRARSRGRSTPSAW